MIWYVDGVERQRVTQGVPSSPMVIIANLAVGGPQSWSGPTDATTSFPAKYKIDYIRVFQRK
jgi:beta-glucanase (GH16 family)